MQQKRIIRVRPRGRTHEQHKQDVDKFTKVADAIKEVRSAYDKARVYGQKHSDPSGPTIDSYRPPTVRLTPYELAEKYNIDLAE